MWMYSIALLSTECMHYVRIYHAVSMKHLYCALIKEMHCRKFVNDGFDVIGLVLGCALVTMFS